MKTEREPIICAACGTPVAEFQGPCLVIIAKHHGEKHVTIIEAVERRVPSWKKSANTDVTTVTNSS